MPRLINCINIPVYTTHFLVITCLLWYFCFSQPYFTTIILQEDSKEQFYKEGIALPVFTVCE